MGAIKESGATSAVSIHAAPLELLIKMLIDVQTFKRKIRTATARYKDMFEVIDGDTGYHRVHQM